MKAKTSPRRSRRATRPRSTKAAAPSRRAARKSAPEAALQCPGVDCVSLTAAIRAVAEDVSGAEWMQDARRRQNLVGDIQRIAADFRQHVEEAHGPTGLLACVLNDCPHLSAGVTCLSRQHDELMARLDDLGEALSAGRPRAASPKQLAARLLQTMETHQETGNSLLMDAYQTDLGVGD